MSDELKHIAIVMDGNGRWAKKRGLPRSMGHKEGLNTVKRITKALYIFYRKLEKNRGGGGLFNEAY